MTANSIALREERAIAEVQRLSHSGLAPGDLLQRVARSLHRILPFDFYAAATIDPVSSLITHAFAELMDDRQGQLRPVNPTWFERFYFDEGFEQTVALQRRGQWVTTVAEETGGLLERSYCYRESMRPAGVEHKLHAIFPDRGLWRDMELYRGRGSADFSAREVELVRRVAPVVGAGLKAAILRSRGTADEAGESTPGVLVIDHQGRVTPTTAAERL